MIEFKLPSLGSDMDHGTLVQWCVEPGQAVKKGDVVAVVDTSKAAVDVEIWIDGTVHALLAKIGDTIPVGTPMALVLAPGEVAPAQPAPQPQPQPVQPAPVPAERRPAEASAAQAAAPEPSAPRGPAPLAAPAAIGTALHAAPRSAAPRARVTPAARQRAAQLHLAPDTLIGSGPDGAVTLADVERAAAQASAPAAAPRPEAATTSAPTPPSTSAHARPAAARAAEMRKAIGAAMARSKREIPHYYLREPIALRAALDWLRAFNAERSITERVLPAALLLKAVARSLAWAPQLNGHFVDGTFHAATAVHVGVAISLRGGGLVAPALHDAATTPLPQLMRELANLVQRARAGSLRSSEMSDPTITVTNLGEQSVESVLGVIYPPQVALVGFGRIDERPWAVNGALAAMPSVVASLAADHRVSDGHVGAAFLARLRDVLQQPQQLEE